jgi:hypothetical protein
MTRSYARRLFTVLALGVLALLAGCSGRAAVSGTVTCDGALLDGGRITFLPEGGNGPVASAPIAAGKYSLPSSSGPVLGKNRVEIVWYKKTGKQVTVPGDPGNLMEETVQVLHPNYNSGSTLSAEVTYGSNEFDFTVKAGAGKSQGGKVKAVGD